MLPRRYELTFGANGDVCKMDRSTFSSSVDGTEASHEYGCFLRVGGLLDITNCSAAA